MSLIHNERTKLTANWMNALASGSIITGVVAPLIAVTFGLSNVSVGILLLSALFWLSAGVALHFLARRILGRLQP